MANKILKTHVGTFGSGGMTTFTASAETIISKIFIYGQGDGNHCQIEVNPVTGSTAIMFYQVLNSFETFEVTGGICLQSGDAINVYYNMGDASANADISIFGVEL